jgi:hypothetical protein
MHLMFKKSMTTVGRLCKELRIEKIGDRIAMYYTNVRINLILTKIDKYCHFN